MAAAAGSVTDSYRLRRKAEWLADVIRRGSRIVNLALLDKPAGCRATGNTT